MHGVMRVVAVCAAIGTAVVVGNADALAYQSGSIGYDISFPQCGKSYPSSAIRSTAPPIAPRLVAAVGRLPGPLPQSTLRLRTSLAPPALSLGSRFGIVGVDSGNPFISATNPGNPCLADEYARTVNPALYINTGYDPSYTDANHTTPECTTLSAGHGTNLDQQQAWAVGCSEVQKDFAYVSSQKIVNRAGWWLDVETGNSWCGLHAVSCDQSLNQYAIQGIIDTLLAGGASPVGVYSNKTLWSAIVGSNTVHGQTADWVAIGPSTAQVAATHCNSANSFTGDPVKLVQFVVGGTVDRDYAC